MRYLKDVVTLEYDRSRCTGCGRCLEVCPHQVFVSEGRKVTITERDRCMECGACMMNCRFDAVTVKKGVGCAAAVIYGFFNNTEPTCGCGGESSSCDEPRTVETVSSCCTEDSESDTEGGCCTAGAEAEDSCCKEGTESDVEGGCCTAGSEAEGSCSKEGTESAASRPSS